MSDHPDTFPILRDYKDKDPIKDVPWAMLASREDRVKKNHDNQDLARLSERGGLTVIEVLAAMDDTNFLKALRAYKIVATEDPKVILQKQS
jgi:hypothetical protein